jgi:hypothetical protein
LEPRLPRQMLSKDTKKYPGLHGSAMQAFFIDRAFERNL